MNNELNAIFVWDGRHALRRGKNIIEEISKVQWMLYRFSNH